MHAQYVTKCYWYFITQTYVVIFFFQFFTWKLYCSCVKPLPVIFFKNHYDDNGNDCDDGYYYNDDDDDDDDSNDDDYDSHLRF